MNNTLVYILKAVSLYSHHQATLLKRGRKPRAEPLPIEVKRARQCAYSKKNYHKKKRAEEEVPEYQPKTKGRPRIYTEQELRERIRVSKENSRRRKMETKDVAEAT